MRYVDLCQHEFPDLRMTRLRSITSSNGPRLKFLVNMLPTGARLEHRASNGHVDLTLQNRDARALAENLGYALPNDLSIYSARRSAIVRADVPRLVATEPFDAQGRGGARQLGSRKAACRVWPIVGRRMGYDPKLSLLQEPLGRIPKLAANFRPAAGCEACKQSALSLGARSLDPARVHGDYVLPNLHSPLSKTDNTQFLASALSPASETNSCPLAAAITRVTDTGGRAS